MACCYRSRAGKPPPLAERVSPARPGKRWLSAGWEARNNVGETLQPIHWTLPAGQSPGRCQRDCLRPDYSKFDSNPRQSGARPFSARIELRIVANKRCAINERPIEVKSDTLDDHRSIPGMLRLRGKKGCPCAFRKGAIAAMAVCLLFRPNNEQIAPFMSPKTGEARHLLSLRHASLVGFLVAAFDLLPTRLEHCDFRAGVFMLDCPIGIAFVLEPEQLEINSRLKSFGHRRIIDRAGSKDHLAGFESGSVLTARIFARHGSDEIAMPPPTTKSRPATAGRADRSHVIGHTVRIDLAASPNPTIRKVRTRPNTPPVTPSGRSAPPSSIRRCY